MMPDEAGVMPGRHGSVTKSRALGDLES